MIVLPPEILTQTGFSRASTATYIDVDGVLKTAPANVPRPLYVGGALRGVMLEPAATNYCYWGTVLENAAWIKTNVAVTANAALAPDGTMTADRLIENTVVDATHYINQNVTHPAGGRIVSIYAQAVGARTLIIQVVVGAIVWTGTFDLTGAGAVIPSVGGIYTDAPATIERVGTSASYRCSIWIDGPATVLTYFFVVGLAAGQRVYTGNGSSGLYLWGADVEPAAVPGPPSSAILTTGAAIATRAADVLALTGRDVLYSNAVEPSPAWVNGSNIVQGEVRVRPSSGRRYSALVAITGSAIAPESDPARWKDIGAVNPLAMFDPGRNLQTVGPVGAKLRVAVYCAGRINSLFLTRLAAASGTVVMYVAGAEVYRKDMVLTGRKTRSWSTYCLGTFSQLNSVLLTDLPMLAGCTIVLELDNGAFAAKCASMVIGQRVQLGDTEWGGSSDPLVFSVVNRDDFGNAELVPRRMAPATSQTLKIPASQVPTAIALREQLNARFAVWAGMNDNTESPWSEMFLICGIYTRFKVTALSAKEAGVDLDLQEF